jgi:hypothetical protein
MARALRVNGNEGLSGDFDPLAWRLQVVRRRAGKTIHIRGHQTTACRDDDRAEMH